MADDIEQTDPLSFIPEAFKGEAGYDTAKFRADYDEAVAFRATEAERKAALPKEPGEYAFALPDDHRWPDGFDAALVPATKGEDGKDIPFDPASLLSADDPDVPLVQALLHELGAPKEAMGKIASIFANREIRGLQQAVAAAAAEKKALGPDAPARIATAVRALETRLPGPQAKALADAITSADALRAVEGLIAKSVVPVSPAATKQNLNDLPIGERITQGLRARRRGQPKEH